MSTPSEHRFCMIAHTHDVASVYTQQQPTCVREPMRSHEVLLRSRVRALRVLASQRLSGVPTSVVEEVGRVLEPRIALITDEFPETKRRSTNKVGMP